MITCLGRQDFYVGDYDYNGGGGGEGDDGDEDDGGEDDGGGEGDVGGEGDGGVDATDQPLFLWEGLSGGDRGTAGGQGGAPHHIWIIVYDIIDNDI